MNRLANSFKLMALAGAILLPTDLYAIGRGGGGARGGGGGRMSGMSARPSGGGSHFGGGSRPSMPSGSRTSIPNFGGSNLSTNRPSTGLNRPSTGGLHPGSGSRPNLSDRPSTRPGSSGSRPNTSFPNLGAGNSRPGTSRPDTSRPGAGNRPGTGNRPDFSNRPSPGDLGDFLGMDRPLRPGTGTGDGNRFPNRPDNQPGHRPGQGIGNNDRFPNRPNAGNRPDAGNRPNAGDRRPGQGDRNRWDHNNVINNHPKWANIDNSTRVNIHNRWNNAFVNPRQRDWWNVPPGRRAYWNGWANGVRAGWHARGHYDWFSNNWWHGRYFPAAGWHYGYWYNNYPWRYWWTVPTWAGVTAWFNWTAPATVWAQPVYYTYGTNGNVVYDDNNVYVGGEQVATTEEFAQSAMDLATVPPPESEDEAKEAEWMPLGTFSISRSEKDTDPTLVAQLAVSRDGIISGTLFNTMTDQVQAIQGRVDKETQRVAFRVGESENFVAETGLYDLTQSEAPLLVHFGPDKTENWLMVRMEAPPEGEEEAATGDGN